MDYSQLPPEIQAALDKIVDEIEMGVRTAATLKKRLRELTLAAFAAGHRLCEQSLAEQHRDIGDEKE